MSLIASGQATHNFTGKAGSYTADSLIRLLGVASFLLPLILLVCSFKYFLRPEFTINAHRSVGFLFFVLSFAGIMAILISGSVTIYGESLKNGTGGLIGVSIVDFLRIYFNVAGTYIILFLIFVVALTFMVEFSIVSVTERISQFVVGAIHSLQKPYLVFCKLCSQQRENGKKTATGDNRRYSAGCKKSKPQKKLSKPILISLKLTPMINSNCLPLHYWKNLRKRMSA